MAPDNVFDAESKKSDFADEKNAAAGRVASVSRTTNILKALIYGTHLAVKYED